MILAINIPFNRKIYGIVSDCPDLLTALRLMYGKYAYSLSLLPENKQMIRITVETVGENQFTIMYNGIEKLVDNPMQEIVNIIFESREYDERIFAMHAGAVAKGNKALLFAAPTSNGKTTLTAYLISRGYDYITDDCVFIDMESLAVFPFHKPLHLRDGGLQVLMKHHVIPEGVQHIDKKSANRHVFMPANLSAEVLEIAGIYLIERSEGENCLLPISGIEAIRELMLTSVTPYHATPRYIQFLKQLSPNCKRMQYCEFSYVEKCLEMELSEK